VHEDVGREAAVQHVTSADQHVTSADQHVTSADQLSAKPS